ncbi:unnamed protein product [Phytophthora fragariaefolia]|uniref:Unnamed protein product n=1 Tax=Phytophthora fragariaefolia TaxID=1490495 RepID=A0A9W7CMV0_9STRA|nr:unnamed protein product [Phytophthora fragariaefolia]
MHQQRYFTSYSCNNTWLQDQLQGLGLSSSHGAVEFEPHWRPVTGAPAPVELFTGLQCPTPLKDVYLPERGELQHVPDRAEIDQYLNNLRTSLHAMHTAVKDQREKQRLLNKKQQLGEALVNFADGDFVRRSRVDAKHGKRLQVK